MTMFNSKLKKAESTNILSMDNLTEVNNIIRNYPIASQEDNLELVRRYREGNPDALEQLIKVNMRLILKQAKRYLPRATTYQLTDLIQEIEIALMFAADSYDIVEPQSNFSTYFINQIKFHVNRELRNNDELVRRPAELKSKIRQYKNNQKQSELVGEEYTDEKAKEELGLTDQRLKSIKSDYKLDAKSIDAKVDENNSSSTELSDFVAADIDLCGSVIDGIVNEEMFISLKQIFKDAPHLYYILISRIYGKKTLDELGSEFMVTGERIRQEEAKATKIVQSKCPDSTSFNYKLERDTNTKILRGAPISPDNITKYMFYRDFLIEKEREIFKLFIKGEYKTDDRILAKVLGLDINEYIRIKKSLFRKINNPSEETAHIYQCFKEFLMKKHGKKIYTIDWDMDLEDIRNDISYIFKIWDNKSYDDVINIIRERNITITPEFDELLRQYFNYIHTSYGEKRKAEHDINKIFYDVKKKNDIPLSKLAKTLKEHEDEFTEEQYDYIMMRLFNKMSKKDFKKKYPYTALLDGSGFYVIARLEALYYNIANYKRLNFTKKKYFQVRNKCVQQLSKEQVAYLDLHYGKNCDSHTSHDIARLLKINYDKARSNLQSAKNAAQSIYLEKSNKKVLETDYYIPYIIDENIDLNDTHRKLLKGYLIDKLSYDDLSKQLGMTKHNVSSNILDGLLKIDFYRFGILKKYEYPEEIFQKALTAPIISEEERNILEDLHNGISRNEVAEKYGKKLQALDTLCTKHRKICHTLAVGNKRLTKKALTEELNIHQAANLLNKNERIILSYTYGIKCDINEKGEKIDKSEFKDYFPELSERYSKLLKSGTETVIGKQLGIDRATLDIIDRKFLRKTLLDPRLPISEKEIELLCYTYELRGYDYKNLNELAAMYKENASSIKRRIQRAIATINRYENGEIKAKISYKHDIEGNLKFFTKKDREILISKYRDNLTYEEIAKKHGITTAQTESLLNRLDNYLRDILDEEIKPFDFDYYYEVVDLEDFPYYDDLKLAKKVFELYFEERLSASEIKEVLDLDVSISVIQRTIQSLIIATSKRKDGIKKVNYYHYEDVINYYKKYSTNMNREQLSTYHKYFRKVDKALSSSKDRKTLKKLPIPPSIIMDLIIASDTNAFSFETASRDEAYDIVNKHKKALSETTLRTLAKVFNISGRECMESKDKLKVLKFLKALNLQLMNPTKQPNEDENGQGQKVLVKA